MNHRLLTIAAAAIAFFGPPAVATTRIVAPSGGDYTSINAAISACSTGDIVEVRAGTYTDATLHKIAFQADANNETLIVRNYTGESPVFDCDSSAAALDIIATGGTFTVQGITFTTSTATKPQSWIYWRSSTLTLASCTFGASDSASPAVLFGLELAGSAQGNATLTGCTFVTKRDWLRWNTGSTAGVITARNCTLEAGNYSHSGLAVGLFGITKVLTGLVVDGCSLTLHGGSTDNGGPMISGSSDTCSYVRITNNTITQHDNLEAIAIGTRVANVVISGNTITTDGDTAGAAVRLGADAATNANPIGRALVVGNVITATHAGASHSLLVGSGSDGAQVFQNRIIGGDIGIVVKAEKCTIAHNTTSGGYGILLKGAGQNTVVHNSVYATTFQALTWSVDTDNPSNNTIMFNVFDGSAGTTDYAVVDSTTTDYSNVLDYNAYVAGDTGFLLIGNTPCATIAEAQTKWQAFSAVGYANDEHSVKLTSTPFASPAAGDHRPLLTVPALYLGANWQYVNIGAFQNARHLPAGPVRK